MSVFRAKIWTGVGAAVLLGAGGLAACSGEGGEGGEQGASAPASNPQGASGAQGASAATGGEGEGGEAGAAPRARTGGEGEGGEAGAAGGEQGASAAVAAVPAESRQAFRLAQLKGFFLAAQRLGRVEGPEAAAALAGQGMLEVFDPARAQIAGGVDEAALRRAAQSGEPAALDAAVRTLQAAETRAGGDPAAVARGLAAVSAGLYREAAGGGALDPIEYQHAYAAALAAQSTAAGQPALSGARSEIDRLVGLWRTPVAPDDAAQAPKLAQVQAQASRVELALSGG